MTFWHSPNLLSSRRFPPIESGAPPIEWLFTSKLLTLLRNGVPHCLSREEIRYARISFSQFGEDLAVQRYIDRVNPSSWIYVDAGCFHPIHCSNTILLHKQGWRGVNIDLDEDKIFRFRAERAADYNVVAALSNSVALKRLFKYQGGLTDRLGEIERNCAKSAIGETPLQSLVVETKTLDAVLESAPWPISEIGYLNIDCEGHDLEVLSGLSLDRYKPAILTIEALADKDRHQITAYLGQYNYKHVETIYRTLVFVNGAAHYYKHHSDLLSWSG